MVKKCICTCVIKEHTNGKEVNFMRLIDADMLELEIRRMNDDGRMPNTYGYTVYSAILEKIRKAPTIPSDAPQVIIKRQK